MHDLSLDIEGTFLTSDYCVHGIKYFLFINSLPVCGKAIKQNPMFRFETFQRKDLRRELRVVARNIEFCFTGWIVGHLIQWLCCSVGLFMFLFDILLIISQTVLYSL